MSPEKTESGTLLEAARGDYRARVLYEDASCFVHLQHRRRSGAKGRPRWHYVLKMELPPGLPPGRAALPDVIAGRYVVSLWPAFAVRCDSRDAWPRIPYRGTSLHEIAEKVLASAAGASGDARDAVVEGLRPLLCVAWRPPRSDEGWVQGYERHFPRRRSQKTTATHPWYEGPDVVPGGAIALRVELPWHKASVRGAFRREFERIPEDSLWVSPGDRQPVIRWRGPLGALQKRLQPHFCRPKGLEVEVHPPTDEPPRTWSMRGPARRAAESRNRELRGEVEDQACTTLADVIGTYGATWTEPSFARYFEAALRKALGPRGGGFSLNVPVGLFAHLVRDMDAEVGGLSPEERRELVNEIRRQLLLLRDGAAPAAGSRAGTSNAATMAALARKIVDHLVDLCGGAPHGISKYLIDKWFPDDLLDEDASPGEVASGKVPLGVLNTLAMDVAAFPEDLYVARIYHGHLWKAAPVISPGTVEDLAHSNGVLETVGKDWLRAVHDYVRPLYEASGVSLRQALLDNGQRLIGVDNPRWVLPVAEVTQLLAGAHGPRSYGELVRRERVELARLLGRVKTRPWPI